MKESDRAVCSGGADKGGEGGFWGGGGSGWGHSPKPINNLGCPLFVLAITLFAQKVTYRSVNFHPMHFDFGMSIIFLFLEVHKSTCQLPDYNVPCL